MKKLIVTILSFVFGSLVLGQSAGEFTIARLKYNGGGDWYSNQTSLPNLLREVGQRLKIKSAKEEAIVAPSATDIFAYPLLYMNGHGTVSFSSADVRQLQAYFHRGGFLWADDNYGMDASFRREIAKVFPDSPLVEIPFDHPVYHVYYSFANGLPKIHEHDGGPPKLLGIFQDDRLSVLYTFNTDIGDGLESEGVHKEDSPQKREEAMKMALNIVLYVLTN
jgi:hypothetical protein